MRTFHFTSITAAAKFINANGLPSIALKIIGRNSNGVASYCEVTAPAEFFAEEA